MRYLMCTVKHINICCSKWLAFGFTSLWVRWLVFHLFKYHALTFSPFVSVNILQNGHLCTCPFCTEAGRCSRCFLRLFSHSCSSVCVNWAASLSPWCDSFVWMWAQQSHSSADLNCTETLWCRRSWSGSTYSKNQIQPQLGCQVHTSAPQPGMLWNLHLCKLFSLFHQYILDLTRLYSVSVVFRYN